jgi:hypothetical protein
MKGPQPSRLPCGLLIATAFFIGAAGAQSQPVTVLPEVGPDTAPKTPVSGYLVVYTDTENPINVGDIVYYPHTAYTIYDSHGRLFKSVRNHMSERDELPTRVSLPPGHYTVMGKSETQGQVVVPVIISGLRTTVVNLEKRSHAG